MQAFLPEQRRSMRMDFRINGRPEKRTPRLLRASIPLRRAVGCERRRTDGGFCRPPPPRSGDYAWAAEHALRADTFRAADMPWAVDKPSENVGGGEHGLRGDRRERTDGAWSAGHTLRGTRFRAAALCGFPARRTPAASRNRPETAARRVLSERRKNKRRFC